MIKIFLSYARKDITTVNILYEKLIGAGYRVWKDTQSIQGGQKWREMIVEAIDDAQVFVLALSPNSITSVNVRKEIDLAESADKLIIPVIIKNVELPIALKYQLAGTKKFI